MLNGPLPKIVENEIHIAYQPFKIKIQEAIHKMYKLRISRTMYYVDGALFTTKYHDYKYDG